MSDKFYPLSAKQLTNWIATELQERSSIFGIPKDLFFRPTATDSFKTKLYNQALETPFGVAAGPHSQLARNLIASWLCGGRFLELKTIQTLDELEVSKPCIDMQDEGYNVEWSQELKIPQSFEQYLLAWVLIHVLHRVLEFPGDSPGVIFNMSVGYDLAGVQQENVQWFLRMMNESGELKDEYLATALEYFPQAGGVAVPSRISDNVTVSTMHGCPPEEIGKICRYLMEEWHLHTNVKLNPTLLGPDGVRSILNGTLGFEEVTVPDEAFAHDLKYPDAIDLLTDLRTVAPECGVTFGVKLCNTLEVENHRNIFSADNKMMYLSGRPHHAVAVNVAHKLSQEFNGDLLMSFAGGVDAFNVSELLRCGMATITTCSDILRPGGYTRLPQYVEETATAMKKSDAGGIVDFINSGTASADTAANALSNLKVYAKQVVTAPAYCKDSYERAKTKTSRPLGFFDCIDAPCTTACAISQQVPSYLNAVARDDIPTATAVVRQDNAMPAVLGRACTHLCENFCVRTHYDDPVAIRELKRFIIDNAPETKAGSEVTQDARVAIVGGGPCGIGTALFLSRAGFSVTIFEARSEAGGMVSALIPTYRATPAAMDKDLHELELAGVEFRFNQRAGRDFTLTALKDQGFKYVVVAAGAQRGMQLGIEGEEAEGVLDGLDFLRAARAGDAPQLGKRVGIIGGGDAAMDCARVAQRLTGGTVQVIYRRTQSQMPAHREEIQDLLDEGVAIMELSSPAAVLATDGRLTALHCAEMKLGEPDASGRKRPIPTGEEFDIPLDNLIIAIGQRGELDFIPALKLNAKGYIETDPATFATSVENVYAGGDAIGAGPETIVKALGDGKAIAAAIAQRENTVATEEPLERIEPGFDELMWRRSRRTSRVEIPRLSPENRSNFEEVVNTLDPQTAREEASRCLQCDLLCSICTSVCPNRAFITLFCEPFATVLPTLTAKTNSDSETTLERSGETNFQVRQAYQTVVAADCCNECGNCATFCPTAGKPYQDKPRIYQNRDEFVAQDNNAFLLSALDDGIQIQARFDGQTEILAWRDNLEYESHKVKAVINPDSFELIDVQAGPDCVHDEQLVLTTCASMFVLLRNIRQSASYLLDMTALSD